MIQVASLPVSSALSSTSAPVPVVAKRKQTRASKKLDTINSIVDWDQVLELIQVVDKTSSSIGGAPHIDLSMKIKILFVQFLYNFSNPEVEDQLHDRISFQQFCGIDAYTKIPHFTTIWRFKESLIKADLLDRLFNLILSFIEARGLCIKKGTSMDATIIKSTTKPLSKERRGELENNPSSQIDTDAHATVKRGKKYFGYKGHIGTDVGSDLIRKRAYTSAQPHDSKLKGDLLSGDEQAVFGDSAYGCKADKQKARKKEIYYGILDKATRRRKLSNKQKKNNKKKSKIRCKVEHPFAYIKEKLGYQKATAKTLKRNALQFDFNCIIYNIFRADFLMSKI